MATTRTTGSSIMLSLMTESCAAWWSAAAGCSPANESFKYSNIGYGLLGLVIEAASGLRYNAYVSSTLSSPWDWPIPGRRSMPAMAGPAGDRLYGAPVRPAAPPAAACR